MKKLVALVLLVLLTLGVYAPAALADGEEPETFYNAQDYVYVLKEDGTAEITGYTGSSDQLTIPAELDGHAVTSLRHDAFWSNQQLNAVTVPDTVKEIGHNAFGTCFNLRTVTLSEGLESMGDSPFYYCRALNSVNIPDSVTVTGEGLFAGCDVLREIKLSPEHPLLEMVDVVLFNKVDSVLLWYPKSRQGREYQAPEGTKRIGYMAFFDTNLQKIELPVSVETIAKQSFLSCWELKTVNIPPKVTDVNGIFSFCDHLEAIVVDEGNEVLQSIDGVLFDMTTHALHRYPSAKQGGSYTIPEGTEVIADSAFEYAGFSEVIIPDSVRLIDGNAFLHCEKLKEVVLPEGLETLGASPFQFCVGLEKVSLPDSLTKVTDNPFLCCQKLKEIVISENQPILAMMNGCLVQKEEMTLLVCPPGSVPQKIEAPEGIRSVAPHAFNSCSNLQEIVFGEGLERINYWAFAQCYNLKRVVLPASLTFISSTAFEMRRLGGTTFVVPADSYAENFCTSYGLKVQHAG